LFALVYCCQKWRPYLDGTTVTAYTDHDPLKFVQTQKQLNAKQVRWLQFLQSFKPNIIYKPGVGNPADALTRFRRRRREPMPAPWAGGWLRRVVGLTQPPRGCCLHPPLPALRFSPPPPLYSRRSPALGLPLFSSFQRPLCVNI
jgi:hypothetical protein